MVNDYGEFRREQMQLEKEQAEREWRALNKRDGSVVRKEMILEGLAWFIALLCLLGISAGLWMTLDWVESLFRHHR